MSCSNFFVSFDFTSDALQEIESFFERSHKVIVALTVQEILDEQIAKNWREPACGFFRR